MAQCDAQSLVNQANCILCGVPQGMYLPILIALMCQIQAQGTGGGGAVFAGNYAGGQPNFTPTTSAAIAIDTSNGTQWDWYSNAWH